MRLDRLDPRSRLENVECPGHAQRGRGDDAIDRIALAPRILADQFGPALTPFVDRTVEIAFDGGVPTRFRMAQDRQILQNRSPSSSELLALSRNLMTLKRQNMRFRGGGHRRRRDRQSTRLNYSH